MEVEPQSLSSSASPAFLVPDRAQKLDMLMHVQEFSAIIALITGALGVGKSRLLQAAEQQLSIHHQVISLSATQLNSESMVIETISEQLGCLPSLSEVESVLSHMQAQEEVLHVIIDDAQLLEQDALEILLTKSLSANGWHLTLAGDEYLKQRLDEMQVSLQQENFYHLVALDIFSEEDCNHLVKDLYQEAGFSTLPVSAKKLHQLYLLSEGNAAKLVEYVESDQQQKEKSAGRFPLTHVAALILVGAALLVSTLYQGDATYDQEDAIAQLLEQGTKKEPLIKVAPTTAVESKKPSSITQSKQISQKTTGNSELNGQTEPVSQINIETKESKALELARQNAKQAADDASKAEEEISRRQLEQQKRVKLLAQKAVKQSRQHPLLGVQGKSYVLQLLGVRSKTSAEDFIARFSRQLNASDLNIYETKYKGAPWFVVVYGPFDTHQLASKQAGSLAKSMKGTPWVRPLSKIQEDIRQLKPH